MWKMREKNNRKTHKTQQKQKKNKKQNETKFEQNAGWYAWMAIKSPKYFGVEINFGREWAVGGGVQKLSVKNSLGKLNVEISLWKTQLPTS